MVNKILALLIILAFTIAPALASGYSGGGGGANFGAISTDATFTTNGTGLVFPRGATLKDSGTNAVTLTGDITIPLGNKIYFGDGTQYLYTSDNYSIRVPALVAGTFENTYGIYSYSFINITNYGGDHPLFSGTPNGTQISPIIDMKTNAGGVAMTLSPDGLLTCPALTAIVTTVTPATAPSAPASGWVIYCDSGDSNKLKAKASNGTTVTLGTP